MHFSQSIYLHSLSSRCVCHQRRGLAEVGSETPARASCRGDGTCPSPDVNLSLLVQLWRLDLRSNWTTREKTAQNQGLCYLLNELKEGYY